VAEQGYRAAKNVALVQFRNQIDKVCTIITDRSPPCPKDVPPGPCPLTGSPASLMTLWSESGWSSQDLTTLPRL
jgi:hypothetical protein